MNVSYFIRRGTTVKGPFSPAKLKALAEKKKLSNADHISETADGPWESLASAYQKIFSISQSGAELPLLTVTTWHVKKGLLGKYYVDFRCPNCNEELKSDKNKLVQRENCPVCKVEFVFDESVADELSSIRQRLAAETEATFLDKKQRKEEQQREEEHQIPTHQMDNPTARQLEYAQALGIRLEYSVDKETISKLIDKELMKRREEPNQNQLRLAQHYGIDVTRINSFDGMVEMIYDHIKARRWAFCVTSLRPSGGGTRKAIYQISMRTRSLMHSKQTRS